MLYTSHILSSAKRVASLDLIIHHLAKVCKVSVPAKTARKKRAVYEEDLGDDAYFEDERGSDLTGILLGEGDGIDDEDDTDLTEDEMLEKAVEDRDMAEADDILETGSTLKYGGLYNGAFTYLRIILEDKLKAIDQENVARQARGEASLPRPDLTHTFPISVIDSRPDILDDSGDRTNYDDFIDIIFNSQRVNRELRPKAAEFIYEKKFKVGTAEGEEVNEDNEGGSRESQGYGRKWLAWYSPEKKIKPYIWTTVVRGLIDFYRWRATHPADETQALDDTIKDNLLSGDLQLEMIAEDTSFLERITEYVKKTSGLTSAARQGILNILAILPTVEHGMPAGEILALAGFGTKIINANGQEEFSPAAPKDFGPGAGSQNTGYNRVATLYRLIKRMIGEGAQDDSLTPYFAEEGPEVLRNKFKAERKDEGDSYSNVQRHKQIMDAQYDESELSRKLEILEMNNKYLSKWDTDNLEPWQVATMEKYNRERTALVEKLQKAEAIIKRGYER